MTMEFNSNYNDFIESCRKKYEKTMKDFQNIFDQINQILSPLNNSKDNKEISIQFNSLISKLNQSCSELRIYSFINSDAYLKITTLIYELNVAYINQNVSSSTKDLGDDILTSSLLKQIAQIPSFFFLLI